MSAPALATPADAPILLREMAGPVAVLTLNRPAQRNSLSEALIAELHQALAGIASDKAVRAVVIAAHGPAFCAGHDLKELTARRSDADLGRAFFARLMSACSAMMQAIVHLPKPVVASVQGIATAAGCQLVASCDLAVASEHASFATPGVDIGLFCSTPMVALSRNVSRKQAMEMLLTGDFIDAGEALDRGLVNRVAAPDALDAAVEDLVTKIVAKAPAAVRIGKAQFYRQIEAGVDEAYAIAGEAMACNMMDAAALDGVQAFIDKRKP